VGVRTWGKLVFESDINVGNVVERGVGVPNGCHFGIQEAFEVGKEVMMEQGVKKMVEH
jgi:serine acetyltransferase